MKCIQIKIRRSLDNYKPKWWNKEIADCSHAKNTAYDGFKFLKVMMNELDSLIYGTKPKHI